ncbi:MAG: hypothetical protein Q9162_001440 [Coniocarpon cinnabarinum]
MDNSDLNEHSQPHCIASTTPEAGKKAEYYKSVQWTDDGSALLVEAESLFVNPEDSSNTNVLPSPQPLTPTFSYTLPTSPWAYTPHPQFSLHYPNAALTLLALRDHPMQLIDLSNPSSSKESHINSSSHAFCFRKPEQDDLITPRSVIFTSPTTFVAGGQNLLATFDLNRPGDPVVVVKTAPGRKYRGKYVFSGPLGQVSALSLAPAEGEESTSSVLAVGTIMGDVGLLPRAGREKAFTSFSVRPDAEAYDIAGDGVMTLKWSLCGTYIYVAERKSNGILIYDVRNARRCIAACIGRRAMTNQCMEFDVVGSTVLAGGTDGCVRVWNDAARKGERVEADDTWKFSENVVGCLAFPSWGGPMATGSGSKLDTQREVNVRREKSSDEDTERADDLSSDSSAVSSVSTLSSSSSDALESEPPNGDAYLKLWTFSR